MSPLEIGTFVFGLVSVWLTVKQNIWCWPTGIAMVVLYGILAYQVRLYSDVMLQVVFVFLQIYGWYNWLHGGRVSGVLDVSRMSARASAAAACGAVSGSLALGYFMATRTDADLAYWNAATTVLSLMAQWLMARKVLESWLIWITVDLLYIGLFAVKRLPLMGCLYAVFLALATSGLVAWKRSLRPVAAA
ncbi:MAG: nicotinamide mononucleotide transporter [Acidobacteria bacterium]|nr:nicotinamide mononucleotide transporter [Acidobacteriota bacterium]